MGVKIHFCSQCGSGDVRYAIPEGDSYRRYICGECGFIHYQNPNIVAGCLVTHQGKILICKRAIQPKKDLWTLPAGFMENHETMSQAAERETWEEARAHIHAPTLYTLFNLPHINQVYAMYHGELAGGSYAPGPESTEVKLVHPHEIPWDMIAFATIRETLKLYIQDLEHGRIRMHYGDIIRPWVLTDPTNAELKNLVST